MDVLRHCLGVTLVAAGSEQRPPRLDGAPVIAHPYDRALNSTVLDEQILDVGVDDQLAARRAQHQSPATVEMASDVSAVTPAEPEHRHLRTETGPEGLEPRDRRSEALDESPPEKRFTAGINLRQNGLGRGRPQVPRVPCRAADLPGPLDDDDRRTGLHRPGRAERPAMPAPMTSKSTMTEPPDGEMHHLSIIMINRRPTGAALAA
jgi:hypothetical protein